MGNKTKITKEEVQYVAKLARLYLNDSEAETFTGQLDTILDYINQLNELDVSDVMPTAQSVSSGNVLREDKAEKKYTTERSLKNAPLQEEGFFKVPKVLE